MRSIVATVAGASLALSIPAVAGADTRFPNANAACVAQAWVPANTDPAVPPGTLAGVIREFAHTGEWGHVIAQRGCKP